MMYVCYLFGHTFSIFKYETLEDRYFISPLARKLSNKISLYFIVFYNKKTLYCKIAWHSLIYCKLYR